MGYDLSNESGATYQFRVVGWWYLLNMAKVMGWNAAGTFGPAESTGDWDGNYFANDGQFVTASDAMNLADAIDRLLNDPDRQTIAKRVQQSMNATLEGSTVTPARLPDVFAYPIEYIRSMMTQFAQTGPIGGWDFSDSGNAYLTGFIAFCRAGGFKID